MSQIPTQVSKEYVNNLKTMPCVPLLSPCLLKGQSDENASCKNQNVSVGSWNNIYGPTGARIPLIFSTVDN